MKMVEAEMVPLILQGGISAAISKDYASSSRESAHLQDQYIRDYETNSVWDYKLVATCPMPLRKVQRNWVEYL